MTDKQIIYDDVEVKDCIAYAKSQTIYLGNTLYSQAENICMVKNQPCKFFDCQFKQMARKLKAKEQECERLKEEVKQIGSSFIEKGDLLNNVLKQRDQLKAENEVLEKVNKNNQEKIKKLNAQLEDEFIAKQYGDEALFFTLMDIKELAKQYIEVGVSGQSMTEQYKLKGKEELAKLILQICEVIDV